MAQDTTTLNIDIVSALRGLEKTQRGLAVIKKSLESVASVRLGQQSAANANRAAVATQRLQQQQQRAAVSAQRLAQAQQAVGVRAQQLANAQIRAQQTTQRLAQAQQRLDATTAAVARGLGQQADSHVRAFRAIEAASKKTQQTILNVGNAVRGLGQGMASVGATLSLSLTPPLVALGAAVVNAAVQLDSLKRGLTAIVGSSDEANRQLARLTQIAKLPGIGFEEAIQGSIRLQAVGFSAAEAEKNLREFSNAVALTGGGRDELARVTVQLGQLAAKGKVLSQDLRPIIEAAPAVGRALLQAFGTVNAADIQELGLSSKEFLGILVDELGRLPRAAAGAKNSFENFRDELFRSAAIVGETLLPALTRLVEVVGPIVNGLARAFAALPTPLQIVVVGVGALLAALGPVLFISGQLTLGVGRLIVGLGQLNAIGILPTIANLRALAAGSLSAAAAQRTLAASSALVVAGIGGVLAVVAAAVTAFAIYKAFQKDSITLSKEQVSALTDQIDGLKQQAKFLDGLKTGVERTSDEQERLLDIYGKLNLIAQTRITGIKEEDERLAALRQELQKVIEAREQERIQGAASLAATVTNNALLIAAEDEVVKSLALRVQANTALIETLEKTGRITPEISKQLERFASIAGGNVTENIRVLREENARLVGEQNRLRDASKETRADLKEQVPVLRQVANETNRTEVQLLATSKTMGLFEGDITRGALALRRYTTEADVAASATDRLNKALSGNVRQLIEAGERADAAAKSRQAIIQAQAAIARETSVDFEGALKSLRQSIAAVPELRQAIEREAQIQGKTLEQVTRDALESAFKGRTKDKSGTALRNAQEQLAQALAEVAQASADEQAGIEKSKNDALLQINENSFKLQIVSYRQYLNERARLTSANLQLEVIAQRKVVNDAIAERDRFTQRAGQTRLPAVEREKARVGAATAEEQIIKGRTKINELEAKQRDLVVEVSQLLAESAKQQIADTRKLEIEYAELRGSIEAAAQAATDERFREELQRLAKEQDHLNRLETTFTDLLSREEKEDIKAAKARNQRQIDVITNIQRQEDALGALAAANELVKRAKERQAQLEADLTFQVEFRGLKEEDAIARRLEGERKLNDSLTIAHETIRQIVTALQARGVEPPRALIEFLEQIRTEVKGLGELSFSEQFRLAEKEFTRLNDLRLQKIADVERAVRNRDIAEAEGLLLIRRINGEYVGDLERQLELLKSIATASGDPALQRQAQDAAETTKDAADSLASLDKQIRASSIDALQDGFTNFLVDLTDRTKTAKEKLLDLVNSVANSINRVIAENLSRRLIESLFGGAEGQAGGLIASIKRLFGFGGVGKGGVADATGKALEGTSAAAALQAGATAAAATTTASAITFSTAVTAAATAFAAVITTAGAAFAATVAAGSATQTVSSISSGIGNFAVGDFLPSQSGGMLARIAEGGYPEAVLTTDPRYAARQMGILREYLSHTRGLFGRIPGFASGAFVSRETAESDLLSSIHRAPSSLTHVPNVALAGGRGGSFTLRQILIDDQRDISNWYSSAEGDRVQVQWLARNRPMVRKLLGIRGND